MEAHIEDHEKRLSRIEVWKNGNGAIGAEKRLQLVEESIKIENCFGLQAIKEYIQQQETAREKRRTFRIGDIANIIQLVMLAAVLVQLFRMFGNG